MTSDSNHSKVYTHYANNLDFTCTKLEEYEITNFLVGKYANCMRFVDPFDVKMLVSIQCHTLLQYKYRNVYNRKPHKQRQICTLINSRD